MTRLIEDVTKRSSMQSSQESILVMSQSALGSQTHPVSTGSSDESEGVSKKGRNYNIPSPDSSPKEIVGHHGHKPAGTSIKWPALYRHLRAKGMTKRKAAMISNGKWRRKHGMGPASVPGTKGLVGKTDPPCIGCGDKVAKAIPDGAMTGVPATLPSHKKDCNCKGCKIKRRLNKKGREPLSKATTSDTPPKPDGPYKAGAKNPADAFKQVSAHQGLTAKGKDKERSDAQIKAWDKRGRKQKELADKKKAKPDARAIQFLQDLNDEMMTAKREKRDPNLTAKGTAKELADKLINRGHKVDVDADGNYTVHIQGQRYNIKSKSDDRERERTKATAEREKVKAAADAERASAKAKSDAERAKSSADSASNKAKSDKYAGELVSAMKRKRDTALAEGQRTLRGK